MEQTNSKTCFFCKECKPLNSFYRSSKTKDGCNRECIACWKQRSRRWYERNRERAIADSKEWATKNHAKRRSIMAKWRKNNPTKIRDMSLRYKYNMTSEQWETLFAAQGRQCALCASTEPGGRGFWHTDHDHSTEEVRGILCNRCNTTLGVYETEIMPNLDRISRYRHSPPAAASGLSLGALGILLDPPKSELLRSIPDGLGLPLGGLLLHQSKTHEG
jgi:hypothetical protein